MQDVMNDLSDLNTQFNAAKLVEGNEEADARGAFGNNDGQSAEVRALMNSVSLTDYLKPAGAGTGISGAAAELNAALGVELTGKNGGVAVPYDMLLNPIHAAFTETSSNDGSNIQRPILQRLFGPGVMDALGVRMDTVPVGRSEWPLNQHRRCTGASEGRSSRSRGCRGNIRLCQPETKTIDRAL